MQSNFLEKFKEKIKIFAPISDFIFNKKISQQKSSKPGHMGILF